MYFQSPETLSNSPTSRCRLTVIASMGGSVSGGGSGRGSVVLSKDDEIVHEVIRSFCCSCRVIGGSLTETATNPPFSRLVKIEILAAVGSRHP